MICRMKEQRGIALMGAVFLLVVLAFLSVVVVSLFGAQTSSISMSVNGARCYQAGKAGLEWGIRRALDGNCAAVNGASNAIEGYTVVTTCQADGYTEAGVAYNVFRIGATATGGNLGAIDFVSRRLEVKVTDAN